jgi:hypothetical protein
MDFRTDNDQPTYDFDAPPHGFAKRKISPYTVDLFRQISAGMSLAPQSPEGSSSIPIELFLYNLHRVELANATKLQTSIQALLGNRTLLSERISQINRVVRIMDDYLAIAVFESSESRNAKGSLRMPQAAESWNPKVARAIANQTLENSIYSPLSLTNEEISPESEAESEMNYFELHTHLFTDIDSEGLLTLPGIYEKVGPPANFLEVDDPSAGNQFMILNASNEPYLYGLRAVEGYYDGAEGGFSVTCLAACAVTRSDGSTFFHLESFHRGLTESEVVSALERSLDEINRKISILTFISDDNRPSESWIARNKLAEFDRKSEQTETLLTSPIGSKLATIRFQRLYEILRMLIFLDPILAGKFLAQYSDTDATISGVQHRLADAYCYSIRLLDFEANGAKTINTALNVASTVSALIPVGVIVRALLVARIGNASVSTLSIMSAGMDSPFNALAGVSYALSAINNKVLAENTHLAFSALTRTARSAYNPGDWETAMKTYSEINRNLDSTYHELLVTGALTGGIAGFSAIRSTIKSLAGAPRIGRIAELGAHGGKYQQVINLMKTGCH